VVEKLEDILTLFGEKVAPGAQKHSRADHFQTALPRTMELTNQPLGS
jgi:hypothetical protein